MRSVGVVVDLVLRQHLDQVSAAGNENQVEDLGADGAYETLSEGVGFEARTGVFSTRVPSVRKTSSKDAVYLESRSRMRKQTPSSSSAIERLRACWVTHAASGLRVTPSMWMHRLCGCTATRPR